MSAFIMADENRRHTTLSGLCVMLAECIAIVNLKNSRLARTLMYEENRFAHFILQHMNQPAKAADDSEARAAANTKILVHIGFRA
ncbi:hypothetical protein [Paraburkholderia sp. SIMBA_030]|uniref:hypothetical protein n=1 Tax=Paraburkholderia sp. SIMBA_030 TaxID=3085773 RepID=UPI00397D4857